MLIEDHGS